MPEEDFRLQRGVFDAGVVEAAPRGRSASAIVTPSCSSSRRACSLVETASMKASISPSSTPGMLWSESPTRWSVTRSCGKL